MFRSVDHLLRPKNIAIVGASDSSRGGWAREIYENLEYSGFPARLYLVNPKRSELWGRPVFPNFAAIPVTNASINPARSLGPALFVGGWALGQLWLFILAPIAGGILAAIVYRLVRE